MATAEQKQQLVALTTAMFDAPPGAEFLAEFEGYLDQGLSIEQVAANLAATEAFNAQFSGMDSDDAKINMVLEGFGIDTDSPAYQEAFNFFTESLAAGRNPGEILSDAANFLSTTEDETFSEASATFKNKVETGVKHSIELGLPSQDLAELKSALANVTSDPQSVSAAAQALNEKKEELEQGDEEEDEGSGSGSGGGGGTTTPAFTASVDGSGVVTFGGTATGDISVEWGGTVGDSIATFSRDGNTASTKPDFSTTGSAKSISLSSTQTISDTAADLTGVTVSGADGTVALTDTSLTASTLTTLDAAIAGTLNASNVTTINGTAAEVEAVVNAAGITTATDYAATVSDADADETTLNAILGDTTGIVTASLAGAAATLNSALTNGAATDALTITLDNGAASAIDITELAGKTSVAVDAQAVTSIDGAAAEVKAVVDAGTDITTAADYNSTLSGAFTVSNINAIDSDNGAGVITFNGTENPDTLNFTGVTGDLTINGLAGGDVITGGEGADIITGGGGANTLNGGAGSDTFMLDLADAGSSIGDFTAGASGDELDLNEALTTGTVLEKASGSHVIGGSSAGTVGLFVDTSNNLVSADEAGIETLFAGISNGLQLQSDGADLYFAASDGTNTYIFFLENEGSDSEFTELDDTATLIATLDNVADTNTLTADNFVDFA